MTHKHQRPSEDRIFALDQQHVALEPLDCQGYILDVGGGGEGIIGRLMGERVVAIDPSKSELAETPDGPLKIVMDGRDLRFLDETFHTATAFFTFMYLDPGDREPVLREIHRVLKPGGKVLIWDVTIPPRGNAVKDILVVRLLVTLPDEEVGTGYGVLWSGREQDLASYTRLAENVGFNVVEQEEHDRVFHLQLRKPK